MLRRHRRRQARAIGQREAVCARRCNAARATARFVPIIPTLHTISRGLGRGHRSCCRASRRAPAHRRSDDLCGGTARNAPVRILVSGCPVDLGIRAGTSAGRAFSPRRNAFGRERSASWAIGLLRAEEFPLLMRVLHAAAATHATHRTPRGTRPAQSPPSRSRVACGCQAPTESAPPRRRCRPHPARH